MVWLRKSREIRFQFQSHQRKAQRLRRKTQHLRQPSYQARPPNHRHLKLEYRPHRQQLSQMSRRRRPLFLPILLLPDLLHKHTQKSRHRCIQMKDISTTTSGQSVNMDRDNRTYFRYGYPSNGWTRVSTRVYNYWNEFGNNGFGPWQEDLAEHLPEENKCDKIGNQSPIDLRVTEGSICREGHQIRVRTGDLRLGDNQEIQKLIEGNKLRLLYQRRPCSDLGNAKCAEPDPTLADFPHNWPGLLDLLHIDFKVPSEHTINGKRFDGEMQMFYLHPGRHRTPVASVLMEVTKFGFNIELQKALDHFQIAYDKDMAACEKFQMNVTKIPQEHSGNSTRLGRKLGSDGHDDVLFGTDLAESGHSFGDRIHQANETNQANKTNTEAPTEAPVVKPTKAPAEAPTNQGNKTISQVNKTIRTVWSPGHPLLVPGIYFYGYEGSLTEPPCGEFVSWKVLDTPMKISYKQLEQMKRLIFTHKSPECKFTSRHYNESVARPIQDTADRPVWHCTSDDFAPDR